MANRPLRGHGSYPGGKSGAGVFQRLINLIPPHRVLVVPFAGHCGVVRNIRPADHTVVIDADPKVCEWWHNWRRSKHGRAIEIHHCDGIEWLRFRFGCTEYSAAAASNAGGSYCACGCGRLIGANPQAIVATVSCRKRMERLRDGRGRVLFFVRS